VGAFCLPGAMPEPGSANAMFVEEQAAGAGESESAKADAENQKQDAGKTDAAKADDTNADDAIKKELRARANKLQEERDALLKEKTDREAAEQKRKEKEAAEAGKFEELATTRERERDEAKTEATSLKAENDQLREAMKVGVEAQWKGLPAALQLASKFIPEEDVLGRWTYLNDPDVQKQIKDSDKEVARGSGRDPKSNGAASGVNDDAARRANASRYA
jgi:hypothetical protein